MAIDVNGSKKEPSLFEKLNPQSVYNGANNAFNASQLLSNPISQVKALAGPAQPKPQIAPPDQAQSMNQFLGIANPYRQQALAQGEARGNDLFGNGSLGRIGEGGSTDMGDVLSRLKSQSHGWSDPEAAARKEQAMRGIQSQLATNLRAGRANAGTSGLRGAISQAQGLNAQRAAQQSRATTEQNLFVSGQDAARAGLQNYYTGLGAQENAEQQRTQYNLDQKNKERLGQLATQLGYSSLAAGDVAAAGQNYTGQLNANQAQNYVNQQNQPGFFGRLFGGMFS